MTLQTACTSIGQELGVLILHPHGSQWESGQTTAWALAAQGPHKKPARALWRVSVGREGLGTPTKGCGDNRRASCWLSHSLSFPLCFSLHYLFVSLLIFTTLLFMFFKNLFVFEGRELFLPSLLSFPLIISNMIWVKLWTSLSLPVNKVY